MKWRRRHPVDPGPADEALQRSREQLAEARATRRRFEELADRIRTMRENNHLAEKFRDALEGR